ncbi:MAG: tryptophan 7-halogenase [Woeseiaceae bacterium]|nr:tryptophan 7-halogenase [Woeseiaceae bacterium]
MAAIPEKILIVGGGTSGWMAALHMQDAWGDKGANICLIESPTIGTVGVGEGTTPLLRNFFARLGIPESEWMPPCNATYKCGISFPDWTTVEGYETYFHPFFSNRDKEYAQIFRENCERRRDGYDIPLHPDHYFLTSALARQRRSPIARDKPTDEGLYGYHFDAALMGEFLKGKATQRGVTLIQDTITDVKIGEDGDISHVETQDNGAIDADLFVDCSGFRGLLIRQALNEQPNSTKAYMFNDSAVAIPTPTEGEGEILSETVSKAMRYGWVWHIPLSSRTGNGYVYSSDYASEEEVEAELREYLGEGADGVEALHLHWSPGRLEKHWKNNCVAIGLSQGFLEPLEALMINVIQTSIERFTDAYERGDFTDRYQEDFNRHVNGFIDGILDYLQLHYKLNTRDDTAYWRDNRDNVNMSERLTNVLNAWDRNENIDRVLAENIHQQLYPPLSWYCMLTGMGRFPEPKNGPLRLPTRQQQRVRILSDEHAQAFYPHAEYLDQLYAG